MRDCGCEDCRRRREEADDAFATGVVFAVYWHELHDGFPWETHDRAETPVDGDDHHDPLDGDGFDADGLEGDGLDGFFGW